jgi:hypothetical protein
MLLPHPKHIGVVIDCGDGHCFFLGHEECVRNKDGSVRHLGVPVSRVCGHELGDESSIKSEALELFRVCLRGEKKLGARLICFFFHRRHFREWRNHNVDWCMKCSRFWWRGGNPLGNILGNIV